MELEPPGAASFCLEPEPTQVGRSRSQFRDLGHQEPELEPPKKVAAPQHWARPKNIPVVGTTVLGLWDRSKRSIVITGKRFF